MPIKYFCDECGVEVTDPSFSLDMTGKILCGTHYREYEETMKEHSQYSITWEQSQKKKHPHWVINPFIIKKK